MQLTRRKFITASAIGAGALAVTRGSVSEVLAQTQSGCFITSNFNGTPILGGDYIWFNSVLKVGGLGPDPVSIGFAGPPIIFAANGAGVMVPVLPSQITFTPGAVLATTDFVAGQWITNVPSSGLAGNVFLSGAAFLVPPGGLPGGIKNVSWQAMFCSSNPNVTIQWQWAAAVYRFSGFLDQGYQGLGVKPVDDNHASAYKNSDHAGTPEQFKAYVVGGARGGGGSNFTGSYSGTADCSSSIMSGCGGGSGGSGGGI
jgi:uncharacterized membrane protein YgcG